jgi:mono/diheme cytochrome c family protein
MIDFKKKIEEAKAEVKQNPGALFGLLYPYVLVIIIIIGLYYISNLDDVTDKKVPAFVPDTTAVLDLSVVESRTIPPIDIFNYKESNEELLSKGKELYNGICASCHNETGAGGGPASVGLNPAPRNFTNAEGWKNGRTLSGIYTTLQEGIEGGSMIAYDYIPPEDRIAMAHYIRNEFMTDAPIDNDVELAALDQLYNLSSGMQVPAQIPISSAKQIILNETEQKIEKLDNVVNQIENERTKQSTELFMYIVDNRKLAVSALMNSNEWKNSESDFVDFITANVNQNGFNGRVFNLNDNEWNSLFNYLKSTLISN